MTEHDKTPTVPEGFRREYWIVPGHWTTTTLIGRRSRHPLHRRWIDARIVSRLVPIEEGSQESPVGNSEPQIMHRTTRPATLTAIHALSAMNAGRRECGDLSPVDADSQTVETTERLLSRMPMQSHLNDLLHGVTRRTQPITTRLRGLLGK